VVAISLPSFLKNKMLHAVANLLARQISVNKFLGKFMHMVVQ